MALKTVIRPIGRTSFCLSQGRMKTNSFLGISLFSAYANLRLFTFRCVARQRETEHVVMLKEREQLQNTPPLKAVPLKIFATSLRSYLATWLRGNGATRLVSSHGLKSDVYSRISELVSLLN